MDESGKSGRSREELFALGGVAIRERDAESYRLRADDLKRRFFGTTSITFHEPDMRRGHGPWSFGGDVAKSQAFHGELDALLAETPFVVFGVGVRKDKFLTDYLRDAVDPYLPVDVYALAIQMLLERYVDFLATTQGARTLAPVTMESQGPKEDAVHQRAFANVLVEGTQWIKASAFRDWLRTGVEFVPKMGSHPMEIADMVARDLYEWVQAGCQGEPGRWGFLSTRIYLRGDGAMGKFGVKVFPDSDIRDPVEEHRARCGAQTN